MAFYAYHEWPNSIAIAYWIRTSFGFHTTAIPLSLWERGWG